MNFIKVLLKRKTGPKNDNGFSLLELVVAVGVLLALSVGGFLAYSGINDRAKHAAVESAAATVFTAAHAYGVTEGVKGGAEKAKAEYMFSQGAEPKIMIDITYPEPVI